jgi:hypothetical protein
MTRLLITTPSRRGVFAHTPSMSVAFLRTTGDSELTVDGIQYYPTRSCMHSLLKTTCQTHEVSAQNEERNIAAAWRPFTGNVDD